MAHPQSLAAKPWREPDEAHEVQCRQVATAFDGLRAASGKPDHMSKGEGIVVARLESEDASQLISSVTPSEHATRQVRERVRTE